MSSLALGGIFSSINYDTLIAGMMAAEYLPYNRLQTQKTDYNTKTTAINTIKSSFTNFQNVAAAIGTEASLRIVNTSSSDSNVLTATATDGTAEGSHSFEVNQLAQSHRMVHDAGMNYSTSKVGTGGSISVADNVNTVADASATWFTTGANGATYTFDFGDEGDLTEVVFEANTDYSMDDVVALVNARSQAVGGYDAAEVTGSGPYTLRISAQHKGAVGQMTQTLSAGDAIGVLNDEADWSKTDGTDVSSGVFVYTYDGSQRTINTDANTSLADLRDLINDDSGNPGVTASIVEYNGQHHLVLAGNNTGEDYDIVIDDALTTINGFDTADFYEAQVAQNAKYRMDGMPPAGTYIESSSNTITNAIDGATITLTGTGNATLTLSRNTSSIKLKVQSLLSAYNNLADTIDLYVGYDPVAKIGGVLQGDSTIRALLSPITHLMTGLVPGFDDSKDGFSMAAHIGITIDQEGYLELDEEIFNAALDDNYENIISFIGANSKAVIESNYFQYDSCLDSTQAGAYEVKVTFDGVGAITGAWFRNEGQGDGDWREAAVDGNTITGSADTDEEGLELNVTWDGVSATQTTEIRLQDGFAAALENLVDGILDSDNGPLSLRNDQYETAVESLDKKMELLLDRLERKEAVYQAKFARLEATLVQLDSFRGAFESLFTTLDNNNNSNN